MVLFIGHSTAKTAADRINKSVSRLRPHDQIVIKKPINPSGSLIREEDKDTYRQQIYKVLDREFWDVTFSIFEGIIEVTVTLI